MLNKYQRSYLKYKKKYLDLKRNQSGGTVSSVQQINTGQGVYNPYQVTLSPSYYSFDVPGRSKNFVDTGIPAVQDQVILRIANNLYLRDTDLRNYIRYLVNRLPPNSYIVCVGYCNCDSTDTKCERNTNFRSFSDFQIGISGKAKAKERYPEDTFIREICEETNLQVTSRDLKDIREFRVRADRYNIGVARLMNITRCQAPTPEQLQNLGRDVREDKIIALPYIEVREGENLDGLRYIPLRSEVEKNICQILFLRKDEVTSYIDRLEQIIRSEDVAHKQETRFRGDQRGYPRDSSGDQKRKRYY